MYVTPLHKRDDYLIFIYLQLDFEPLFFFIYFILLKIKYKNILYLYLNTSSYVACYIYRNQYFFLFILFDDLERLINF